MPFKIFFTVLKKSKITKVSGDVPSKLLSWRGRVPSVPPLSTPKAMAYVRGRMDTSDVSLSKLLGWLKPRASQQTLFGDGEVLPSQAHNS